ncbi:MAG: hypothetical protein H7321_09300 [Bacteroidia bacterium]|nr:hypothetical protein [Bacteroidia bacterium]
MPAPKFLRLISGKVKEIYAAVVATADSIVATDATGRIDVSFLPVGVGAEVFTAVASEALLAGDFVNVYSNAGVLNARKADATTNTKPANGFVLANVASAGVATVYIIGQLNSAIAGLTVGSEYFLSTTPGTITVTSPSATGNISQFIGRADKVTEIPFSNVTYIEIA